MAKSSSLAVARESNPFYYSCTALNRMPPEARYVAPWSNNNKASKDRPRECGGVRLDDPRVSVPKRPILVSGTSLRSDGTAC